MAIYTHLGVAWGFLAGIHEQFNATASCRLNLYKGTIPATTAYTEAAFASDLIVSYNQTFRLNLRNEVGQQSGYGTIGSRPLLGPLTPIPTATATGTGTVTWGALIKPAAPTVFLLTTVTGIGTSSMLIINNQNNNGNIITTGDTVTVASFLIATNY